MTFKNQFKIVSTKFRILDHLDNRIQTIIQLHLKLNFFKAIVNWNINEVENCWQKLPKQVADDLARNNNKLFTARCYDDVYAKTIKSTNNREYTYVWTWREQFSCAIRITQS